MDSACCSNHWSMDIKSMHFLSQFQGSCLLTNRCHSLALTSIRENDSAWISPRAVQKSPLWASSQDSLHFALLIMMPMLPWRLSDLRKWIKFDSLCLNEMSCKSWQLLHFALLHLLQNKVSSGQLDGMEAHYTSNKLIKNRCLITHTTWLFVL